MSKETEKRYISRKELSSYLKISITTIDKLTKSGQLKSIRLGNSIRYDQNDLFNTNNSQNKQS